MSELSQKTNEVIRDSLQAGVWESPVTAAVIEMQDRIETLEAERDEWRDHANKLAADRIALESETFESLSTRMMAAAKKEGHSVTIKVKFDALTKEES